MRKVLFVVVAVLVFLAGISAVNVLMNYVSADAPLDPAWLLIRLVLDFIWGLIFGALAVRFWNAIFYPWK
jgi:hypothetical protein